MEIHGSVKLEALSVEVSRGRSLRISYKRKEDEEGT
jgi:hypothetical protein